MSPEVDSNAQIGEYYLFIIIDLVIFVFLREVAWEMPL